MKKPRSIRMAAPPIPSSSPPIRMVQAYQEAVEASKPEGDSSDEALTLEQLMIAGDAAFTALSRLQDFLHQVAYSGEASTRPVDSQVVEDGYEVWLVAADSLVDRVLKLEETCYESETFATFRKQRAQALEFLEETRERRKLESQALRSDQLASLSARLKRMQASSKDREARD